MPAPRGVPTGPGLLPPPTRTVHAVLPHTAHRRPSPPAFSAVLTDLSKLGKPGQHFSHDFFLPGADVIGALERLAASHGATVIVATHDADLAGRAPRRLAMRDGAVADAALSVVS